MLMLHVLAELQKVLACHGGILNKEIYDNVPFAGFKKHSHTDRCTIALYWHNIYIANAIGLFRLAMSTYSSSS
jgi:hypothetical protein